MEESILQLVNAMRILTNQEVNVSLVPAGISTVHWLNNALSAIPIASLALFQVQLALNAMIIYSYRILNAYAPILHFLRFSLLEKSFVSLL